MTKEVKEGKFVVTKVTNIEDLAVDSEIQESDLLVKNDTKIVQFKYV
jgi:hypothetical protein